MAVPEDDIPAAETSAAPGLRLRRWHGLVLVVAAVVLSALGYVWATREQIAANYISSQLRTMGLALPACFSETASDSRETLTEPFRLTKS